MYIMVAVGRRGEIGTGSGLPWARLAGDMARFRRITSTTNDAKKTNAVVMGRRTWDTLGGKPLPNRINVVLSKKEGKGDGAVFLPTVAACVDYLNDNAEKIESSFLIGGNETIRSFMEEAPHFLTSLYITYVQSEFPLADTFVDVSSLEQFFPVVFYRNSDYDSAVKLDYDFVLRWPLLSDI